jgi:septum formation protein
MQLILASTSPRRHELLALLQIPFNVRTPSFEEQLRPGHLAVEQAQEFALGKARSVARQEPGAMVLGSDTIIELDGEVLGKPADLYEARTMLRRMAGRDHVVHTAVALVCSRRRIERIELSTAIVRMKPFEAQAHECYLATAESLGKAGAYSIQGEGGALVESLRGDYPTVVGLPLRVVTELLTQVGLQIPVDLARLYETKPFPNWARFSG